MRIIYLRHADTDWKKVGFLGGTDIDISEEGIAHAQEVSRHLGNFDAVFSSPSRRAVKTAEIMFRIPAVKDNRLREVDFGLFEGMTKDEAESKYTNTFANRETDKWNVPAPEGESYHDAAKRIESFVDDVMQKGYNSIAVVSHATLIKIILVLYASMGIADAEKTYIEPCSAFEFVFENKKVKSWRKL